MPAIDEFRDLTGAIDREAWGHDIIARLITYMEDGESVSTRELCGIYFERDDIETVILMGHQLQIVRGMLENAQTPLFLLNSHSRWFLVPPGDHIRAMEFIVNRSRRMLRAYERLQGNVQIGRATYQIPDSNRLIQAIEGQEPAMEQLGEALDPDA